MTNPELSEEFLKYVDENDDDVVAVCLECFTVIPDSVAERDPFLNAGSGSGTCMYCGGPVAVASASQIPTMKRRRSSGASLN